ncbi:MAG: glycoside hydrolase family 25 protein [Bacteroidales bacterium]|nr:glycoside hydrolase family 25 protein [Bacteroidales bacterium]
MKRIAQYLLLLIMLSGIAYAQKGIDVSRFQDSIDWKKVVKNSNLEFVYVKASEGASIRDQMYTYNVKKAKDAGLLVGSYHVYSSRTTAYQQFANFKKAVGKTKQDIIPVLDIEAVHCHKLYMERVDKLLELMEKEYGAKPMIYTSEKLYTTHFDNKKYKSYHFFIANYKREPAVAYTLWQYTQHGRQKGIAGFVDFSKFNKKYNIEDIKITEKDTSSNEQPSKVKTASKQKTSKVTKQSPTKSPAKKSLAPKKTPAKATQKQQKQK